MTPGFGLFRTGPRYRTTRPDGHSSWLVILTRSGAGFVQHDHQAAKAGPSSLTLIRSDTPQDYGTDKAAGRWTFAFAHVEPRADWVRLAAGWPERWPGVSVLDVADAAVWHRLWSAMTEARSHSHSPLRHREALALTAFEALVWWCDEIHGAGGPAPDPRLRQAAEFARDQSHRAVTADELASAAGLSPSRLTALFRQHFRESPIAFAERLRLERAASLIASAGLSVKEAAAAVGYDDPFYFSRRFTRRMGRPPSSWRAGDPPPAPDC